MKTTSTVPSTHSEAEAYLKGGQDRPSLRAAIGEIGRERLNGSTGTAKDRATREFRIYRALEPHTRERPRVENEWQLDRENKAPIRSKAAARKAAEMLCTALDEYQGQQYGREEGGAPRAEPAPTQFRAWTKRGLEKKKERLIDETVRTWQETMAQEVAETIARAIVPLEAQFRAALERQRSEKKEEDERKAAEQRRTQTTPDRKVARRRAKPTLEAKDDIGPVLKKLSDHMENHGVGRGWIELGGGSVLAAAWDHRRSTDIDLWVALGRAGRLGQAARSEEEWIVLVAPPSSTIDRSQTSWTQVDAKLSLDGVPISLFTSHIPHTGQGKRQMMRGTIFGAATTDEILAGKMTQRWLDPRGGMIPIRDVYDIAVARTLEPRALERVLRGMTGDQRKGAASRLRELPEGWETEDPKPVLDAKFDVDLKGAIEELAEALEAGDIRRISRSTRSAEAARTQEYGREQ